RRGDTGTELRIPEQVFNPDILNSLTFVERDDLASAPAPFDRTNYRSIDGNAIAVNANDDAFVVKVKRLPLFSPTWITSSWGYAVHCDLVDPVLVADAAHDHICANTQVLNGHETE